MKPAMQVPPQRPPPPGSPEAFTPHWIAKPLPVVPGGGGGSGGGGVVREEKGVPPPRVSAAHESKSLKAAVAEALAEDARRIARLSVPGRLLTEVLTEEEHVFHVKSPFKNAHTDELRAAGMVDASGVPPQMKPPTPRLEIRVPRVLQVLRERQNKRSVGALWRMINTDNDNEIDKSGGRFEPILTPC